MVKAAYTKKLKDDNRRGDKATAARLEKAYDAIMMVQLTKRKKGETVSSFKVKDLAKGIKRKRIGRLAKAPSSPAQSKRRRKFKALD